MRVGYDDTLEVGPGQPLAPLIAQRLHPGANMIVALAQAAASIDQRGVIAGDHDIDVSDEHREDAHWDAVDPRAARGFVASDRSGGHRTRLLVQETQSRVVCVVYIIIEGSWQEKAEEYRFHPWSLRRRLTMRLRGDVSAGQHDDRVSLGFFAARRIGIATPVLPCGHVPARNRNAG